MQQYKYDISIEAKAESEADQKMQALTTLAARLTAQELSKLAHIIQHDPVKTALAKRYLVG